jgi:hypothetical protein
MRRWWALDNCVVYGGGAGNFFCFVLQWCGIVLPSVTEVSIFILWEDFFITTIARRSFENNAQAGQDCLTFLPKDVSRPLRFDGKRQST